MKILEVGEDDGMVFFTCNLNDGELVDSYVDRCGALPPVRALVLVKQLLDDLIRNRGSAHTLSGLQLGRVLVIHQDDALLQLRLFDYGLTQAASDTGEARLLRDFCHLLFLLLTGGRYAGGNPTDIPAIAELPTGLRLRIKSALANAANPTSSIQSLHAEVCEAIGLRVTLAQARNLRRLLLVEDPLLPHSHLQDLLLEHIPVETILGPSFQIDSVDAARSHPFAIPATSVATGQTLTLHLVPPARIVDPTFIASNPSQIWRFDPVKQPNLLHLQGLWEGPDWGFVAEERKPGHTLSRLMADRTTLKPDEVMMLLRQIRAGLDQAAESGVSWVDLDPSNIVLCVGYDGSVLPRDEERLLQKRLDAWPRFVVKLRLHKTIRSLCEPRSVSTGTWGGAPQEERIETARDFRARSFVRLAAYLLTGQGNVDEISEEDLGLPAAAASYLFENLNKTQFGERTPTPDEFVEKLERLLSAPPSGLVGNLSHPSSQHEEMQSAGFVSDFEEDWAPADSVMDLQMGPKAALPRREKKARDWQPSSRSKHGTTFAVMATLAAVVIGTTAWILSMGDEATRASTLVEGPSPLTVEAGPETSITPKKDPTPTLAQQPENHPEPASDKPVSVAVKNAAPPSLAVTLGMAASDARQPSPSVTPSPAESPSNESARSTPLPDTLVASLDKAREAAPRTDDRKEQEPVTIRRAIALTSDAPTAEDLAPSKAGMLQTSQPAASHPQTRLVQTTPKDESKEPLSTSPKPDIRDPAPRVEPVIAETASDPVTIRQAIVLSPEEIDQLTREQVRRAQGITSANFTSRPRVEKTKSR